MADEGESKAKTGGDTMQEILKAGNRRTEEQTKQTSAAEKLRDFRVGKEIGSG
jgi:hypothetical protein